jgi:hypothetical protein
MSSGFLCEQNHILLQCEEDYQLQGHSSRRFFDSLQQLFITSAACMLMWWGVVDPVMSFLLLVQQL